MKNRRIKKKEKVREITYKNYVRITLIFIVSFFIVLFLSHLYNSQVKYRNEIPVIRGTLSEITEKDLDNFFLENDDFLLYIGVSDDDNSRKLEEDMKVVLTNRGLLDTIYLNITEVKNKQEFYNIFNSNYATNENLEGYPAFLIISDKKVVDLVQRKTQMITIGDIEQLLDVNEIKGTAK